MYCMKCGVKLSDTEKVCPLCQTRVYHPELTQEEKMPLYPVAHYPSAEPHPLGFPILATIACLLAILVVATCDTKLNLAITWSGYVIGALLLAYEIIILPTWFRKPSPAVFVPCSFVAIGLYLLYIDLATGGRWFLSFAFPVTAVIGTIATAVSVLIYYLRRGTLFIIGGALILLGLFMPCMEFLLNRTFALTGGLSWSVYTLTPMLFFGGTLLFFGICRSARDAVARKFFF